MPGNLCFDSTRAASITAAIPEPSSLAPGASEVKFIDVGDPAVDVALDNDNVVGPLGPALDREHVADRVGVGQAVAGKRLAWSRDRQAIATRAKLLELALWPRRALPRSRASDRSATTRCAACRS